MERAVRRLTQGPRHRFFGYYDKFPWDATSRYVPALEAGIMDQPPGPQDTARQSGYLVRSKDREFATPTVMPDFANPRAVRWWQDKHRPLLRDGVLAFKTDYGDAVPEDALSADGRIPSMSFKRRRGRASSGQGPATPALSATP